MDESSFATAVSKLNDSPDTIVVHWLFKSAGLKHKHLIAQYKKSIINLPEALV